MSYTWYMYFPESVVLPLGEVALLFSLRRQLRLRRERQGRLQLLRHGEGVELAGISLDRLVERVLRKAAADKPSRRGDKTDRQTRQHKKAEGVDQRHRRGKRGHQLFVYCWLGNRPLDKTKAAPCVLRQAGRRRRCFRWHTRSAEYGKSTACVVGASSDRDSCRTITAVVRMIQQQPINQIVTKKKRGYRSQLQFKTL